MRKLPNSRQTAADNKPSPPGLQAYALAVLCLAVAFGIRWLLDPLWGEHLAFMLFYAAVFVVIQIGGIGPFLLTLVGGFLLTAWFFMAPRHSLLIYGVAYQINAIFYFAINFAMFYFKQRTRRALSREQSAREELRKHADALEESRARFEHLFEHSPTPTWVEDWGDLKKWMEQLQSRGDADPCRASLRESPEAVRKALGLVRVLDANEAAIRLAGASNKAETAANLPKLFNDAAFPALMEKLTVLWRNQPHAEHESNAQRPDGQRLDLIIRIDVPRVGAEQELDFTNIIVTATDITERKKAEQEQKRLVGQLQKALSEVKSLSGLLPICASCKKIRDDQGYWNQIELYILQHSNANFTHGLCPECSGKLFPDMSID